jgi:hypothetical protein
LFVALGTSAWAGVPDWLRQAAREPLPAYKADTKGVVLLDEEITTVDDSGEVHTVYRRAVKILRPTAREELSLVRVGFDDETKLTWLKGWSLTPSGQEYEVKEKDAVETGLSDSFAVDNRYKLLQIPGAEVGSVIGFEYQQRRRPYVNQDTWQLQESMPVRLVRYTLRLPSGWEYQTFWNNHEKIDPKPPDLTWEARDVAPLEVEEMMPPGPAIVARMVLHYYKKSLAAGALAPTATWAGVGAWQDELNRGRRVASPELKKQVADLTAGLNNPLDKMNVLAAWVQKQIRYVDIEIGIGGFQPHYAADIYKNRYGDCKDKASLLMTMLKEVGIDSYFLLIDTRRGVVRADTPTAMTFDHAIVAIRVPDGVPTENLYALYKDPALGTLLIFDPTAEMTPLGDLPGYLQQSYALLVTDHGGQIIQTPLLDPSENKLSRTAKVKLNTDGTLSAQVDEERTGVFASAYRLRLLSAESNNRAKTIESLLGASLGNFQLTQASVVDLEKPSNPFGLKYTFSASEYAKKSGPLLLLRPRVIGRKAWAIAEVKRLYPVEFDNASLETDRFDIELPQGYDVDELPDPVNVVYDFGEYHSKVEQLPGKLKYSREFIIKKVFVPTDRLEDLRKFYRQIAGDERSTVVLKQK